jgi:hypothetical protein
LTSDRFDPSRKKLDSYATTTANKEIYRLVSLRKQYGDAHAAEKWQAPSQALRKPDNLHGAAVKFYQSECHRGAIVASAIL